tara:strand:+ start:19801 stop:20016 length:216 start_codon:yes stop_codon:yes gene_type:complete
MDKRFISRVLAVVGALLFLVVCFAGGGALIGTLEEPIRGHVIGGLQVLAAILGLGVFISFLSFPIWGDRFF